jgi:hypothetical protein
MTRRLAAVLLLAGGVLALGTPVWIAYASPDLSGSLLNPQILLWQAMPYVLCAALWLPWTSRPAARAACILSAVLLLLSMVLHVPMWLAAGSQGGDMIGLAFVAVSLGTTACVLVGSAIGAVVIGLPKMRSRAEGAARR